MTPRNQTIASASPATPFVIDTRSGDGGGGCRARVSWQVGDEITMATSYVAYDAWSESTSRLLVYNLIYSAKLNSQFTFTCVFSPPPLFGIRTSCYHPCWSNSMNYRPKADPKTVAGTSSVRDHDRIGVSALFLGSTTTQPRFRRRWRRR